MDLYSFFRSSTSHRLRIALQLKGLHTRYRTIDLRAEEHTFADYKALNPQGLVPSLVLPSGEVLTQSPAIIEWLEEAHPQPALLPEQIGARARVRGMAALVGCDVHPLHNRRVLNYLRREFHQDEVAVNAWCAQWITQGFDALETLLRADSSRLSYCYGNTPGLADVYLVPQVESARRFDIDVSKWPNIHAVDVACSKLQAFQLAAPAVQPDAPAT